MTTSLVGGDHDRPGSQQGQTTCPVNR